MADSAKQFLVIDSDGKGHLPVRDSANGPLNHHLMGAAWAALHGGYRGNKYEGPGKEAAITKLESLYKSEGMDLPSTASELVPRGGSDWRSAIERQPHFVMTLGEPPASGLIRIPIAVTGTWAGGEKKFEIGLDDLEEIRRNFAAKPTGEINVDYEHASEVPFGTGGPVLSAGKIVKLDEPEEYGTGDSGLGAGENPQTPAASPQPRMILWGWFEPTARARELIENKEYRFISPAIRWGAKDKVTGKTIGTVLTSVALVNKPFLEEMPEIHLCELDGTRAFVSLGQLHVPGPVNQDSGVRIQDSGKSPGPVSQISVAFQQPGQESGVRSQNPGRKAE